MFGGIPGADDVYRPVLLKLSRIEFCASFATAMLPRFTPWRTRTLNRSMFLKSKRAKRHTSLKTFIWYTTSFEHRFKNSPSV